VCVGIDQKNKFTGQKSLRWLWLNQEKFLFTDMPLCCQKSIISTV
jgi:hypothetical protein